MVPIIIKITNIGFLHIKNVLSIQDYSKITQVAVCWNFISNYLIA